MMIQKSQDESFTLHGSDTAEEIKNGSALLSKRSFRLQTSNYSTGVKHNTSCDISYNFKQKIDLMFGETKSAIAESENFNKKQKYVRAARSESGVGLSVLSVSGRRGSNERRIKNSVQARIEKMFADVSSSEFEDDSLPITGQKFHVDYIGSVPLPSKTATLEGLQEPLKKLYFNYRKNKYPSSKLQALLEISVDGLKVQHFEEDAVKEKLNPFPSIAVWAALKFVCRQHTVKGKPELGYAFLPIVVDQKNMEKSSLFRALDQSDFSCAIEKTYDDHSPLFVVIMRQSGSHSSNRLECHGFVCATSEDAIVLAANLYESLAKTVSQNQVNNDPFRKKKKIKCKNGLGTVSSIAGSSVCEEHDYQSPRKEDNNSEITKETNSSKKIFSLELPQTFPIEISEGENIVLKNSQTCGNVPLELNLEPDEIISIDDIEVDNKKVNEILKCDSKEMNDEFKDEATGKSSNNLSTARQSSISDKLESGDILTKIVIPRSGSFLNASIPVASRYNRNRCAATNYGNQSGINVNRKNSIHSPLGFIELFNELRIHEGLNSIDEILNMIIDVDGMSFNSLKPIYKEFIFKLAVTLTKDELYQRSKTIMQKQRRKKHKLMSSRRRAFVFGYKFKRAFASSVMRLKPATSITPRARLFPAIRKAQPLKRFPFVKRKKLKKENRTLTLKSNESFFLGFNGYQRTNVKYHSNDIYRDLPLYIKKGEMFFHIKKSTSGGNFQNGGIPFGLNERLKRPVPIKEEENSNLFDAGKSRELSAGDREIVSGYFTCSDCSCNSENCCYCSAGKNNDDRSADNEQTRPRRSSVSSCECDTDSCIESEKCYCNRKKKPSIFEQLKEQGFAASESSASRPSSPTLSTRNTKKNVPVTKTCLQATKSLEFYHVHKTPEQELNNTSNLSRLTSDRNTDRYDDVDSRQHRGKIDSIKVRKYSVTPLMSHHKKKFTAEKQKEFDVNGGGSSDYSENFQSNYLANKYNGNQRINLLTNCKSEDKNDVNYNEFDGVNGFSDSDRAHPKLNGQKILVVSTRDQRGHIKNSVAPPYGKQLFHLPNYPNNIFKNESKRCENDAISVKKTAEIAALFSEMKIGKKNHINVRTNKEIVYNRLNHPFEGFLSYGTNGMCIKNTNLENSLGYFP